MGKQLIRSILAGISISIGALIFLSIKDISLPFAAIFFSIGLLMVLWYSFNLYTGKIGYIKSIKELPKMILMIIGNTIGCLIMIFFPSITPAAAALMSAKLARNLIETFVRAIICGILIYVAVDQFKQNKNPFSVMIAIPAFITAGAEHCIADLCFIFASGMAMFNIHNFIFITIVIIGNAIGSIAFHHIKEII